MDDLFNSKNYEEILSRWINIFKTKMEKIEHKNIYSMWFVLYTEKSIDLCCFKLNLEQLINAKVNKSSEKSVWVDGFVDPTLGNVKIYKSKKRIEMRLYPSAIKSKISFDLKHERPVVDLRAEFQKEMKKNPNWTYLDFIKKSSDK